jgi:hypothetical protein
VVVGGSLSKPREEKPLGEIMENTNKSISEAIDKMEAEIMGGTTDARSASSNNIGGSGGARASTSPAVVMVKLPQPASDYERLGPLASEAVLKLTNETAVSLEATSEELSTKVHELSLLIQKMNEETVRQLTELDSLMKSALLSISGTVRAVRDDGDQRAKMIQSVAESLRRVDQQCQSMRREFGRSEVSSSP